MPPWTKEGGGQGEGVWFENSKGTKAIQMEMKKQIFSKQMFAGPSLTTGQREDFNQMGLLGSSLSTTHEFILSYSYLWW